MGGEKACVKIGAIFRASDGASLGTGSTELPPVVLGFLKRLSERRIVLCWSLVGATMMLGQWLFGFM